MDLILIKLNNIMRKISWIMISIQIVLIVFARVFNYYFHNTVSNKLIFFGEKVMKYQIILIVFFVVSFFIGIFIKEKWWIKIVIIFLAIVGFTIFDKLYLFPW